MSEPAPDERSRDDAIEASIAKHLEAARRGRFARLDRLVLAWLAVAPVWTRSLAEVVDFPVPDGRLDAFLATIEAMGLASIDRRTSEPGFERDRSRTFSLLAHAAGPWFVERAIREIAGIPNEALRAGALVDLVAVIEPAQLPRAVKVAQAIDSPTLRARALTALVRAAPPGARASAAGEALHSMDGLSPGDRARVLAGIVPAALDIGDPRLLEDALDAAADVDDDRERASLLVGLAAMTAGKLGARFVTVAQGIGEPSSRASVLAAASGVLSAQLVRQLRKAFGESAAGALDLDIGDLALAAATIGHDPEAIDAAVRTASGLGEPDVRGDVLGALATIALGDRPKLAGRLARNAADLLASIGDHRRAIVLESQVAERIAEQGNLDEAGALVASAAGRAASLAPSIDAVAPLTCLARAQQGVDQPAESIQTAHRAYELAMRTGDPRGRALALVGLMPLLGSDDREAAEALGAGTVEAGAGTLDQAEILAVLAPHLESTVVDRLAKRILEQVERSGDEVTFAMPEAVREEALEFLTTGTPPVDLRALAQDIGSRVTAALHDGFVVPPLMARWADLAQEAGTSSGAARMAGRFGDDVRAALELGDTTTATSLIAAGTALARCIGAQMDSAVRLANRRLTLVFRAAQDRRHLQQYLERADQRAALTELLGERTEAWGLHFLGMGGVGKTMLLRQLTAEIAPAAGYATARVDFDYMSPDYPVFRPGQLFLELMGELETQATTGATTEYVRRVEDSIVRLHEELSNTGRAEKPLAGLEHDYFEDVLVTFRDFLWSLQRPVLLILDTCEELAKVQSPDASLPSVVATFEILERLMPGAPTVRVVFAGRRLLARSGHGWRAGDAEAGEARALLPDHKPFLQLHEIRGFTATEARTYLSQVKRLEVEPAITTEVLRLSPDTGTAARVYYDPARPVARQRYNPFDLALYADWVGERDHPSPEQLQSADQTLYVDRRILGRIGSPDVAALVAPAVLLRRFDRSALRPAFEGSEADFERAYRELTAQEWIDLHRDERLDTTFLQVDGHLYPRLRAYYDDRRHESELAAAARRLAPELGRGVSERPFEELTPDYVSAAIGLLAPAQASAAWDGIVHRVAERGRWDWADQVTARLLGDDGAAAPLTSPVRAAVAALRASALVHVATDPDTGPEWQVVGRSLDLEPDPEVRDWLAIRRAARQVASGRATAADRRHVVEALREARVPDDPDGVAGARAAQAAVSLGVAAGALADDLEAGRGPQRDADVTAIVAFAEAMRHGEAPAEIRTLASLAAARVLAATGAVPDARAWLAASEAGGATVRPGRWLDWVPPADLLDVVRFHRLRLSPRLGEPPGDDDVRSWMADAATRLPDDDAEALVSASLGTLLSRRPVPAAELDRLAQVDRYQPDRPPARRARGYADPLFVSIALGRLALGDAAGAIAGVQARIDAAAATGADDATRLAADGLLARIARRMRLVGSLAAAVDRLAASDQEADLSLALPAIALTRGADIASRGTIGTVFPDLWWRCQTTIRSPASVVSLLGPLSWPKRPPIGSWSSFDDVSMALDRVEAELEAGLRPWPTGVARASLAPPSLRGRAPDGEPLPGGPFVAPAWADAHPDDPEAAVRLALRAWALGVDAPAPPAGGPGEGPGGAAGFRGWGVVGTRRGAELAFEEGELLALRLPALARPLLRAARVRFLACDDAAGALIATTREILAAAHAAPDGTREPGLLADLEEDHRRLVASGVESGLPAWEELVTSARQGDPSPVARVEGGAWGPWMLRVYLAAAWLSGNRRIRMPASVASVPPAGRPIELLVDPSPEASVDDAGSAPGRTLWPLALGSAVVVGAVALWVLAVGVVLPFTTVLERLGLLVGLFVAIGVLYALIAPLRRAGTALVVAMAPLSLAISAGNDTGPGSEPPLADTLTFRLEQLLPFTVQGTLSLPGFINLYVVLVASFVGVRRRVAERREASAPSMAIGNAYGPPGPRLPGDVVERLRWTQDRLWRYRVPLAMEVAPPSAGAPWDAFVILAAAPDAKRPSDCRLDPYRRGHPVASQRPRTPGGSAVTAIVDRSWTTMVATGWGRQADVTALRDAADLDPKAAHVLHIVGRPVQTTGGTKIQVTGREARETSKSVEAAVRGGGSRGAGMVHPERLPVDGIPLVIVQEEPVEASERAASDRVQAAAMRSVCDVLFGAGAGAVIMVPALPPELAEEVVRILGRRLGSRSRRSELAARLGDVLVRDAPPHDVRELLRAVREVRDRIVDAPPRGQKRALQEIALDVTVFARVRPPATGPDAAQPAKSAGRPA